MANLIAGVVKKIGRNGPEYSASVIEARDPNSVTRAQYNAMVETAEPWFFGHGARDRARMLAFLLAEQYRASSPGGILEVHNLDEYVPDPIPA